MVPRVEAEVAVSAAEMAVEGVAGEGARRVPQRKYVVRDDENEHSRYDYCFYNWS